MKALRLYSLGCLSLLLVMLNTIFWVIPIFILGLIKLPSLGWLRKPCNYLADGCATLWVEGNVEIQNKLTTTTFTMHHIPKLSKKHCNL